jgi:hypothetical protein
MIILVEIVKLNMTQVNVSSVYSMIILVEIVKLNMTQVNVSSIYSVTLPSSGARLINKQLPNLVYQYLMISLFSVHFSAHHYLVSFFFFCMVLWV